MSYLFLDNDNNGKMNYVFVSFVILNVSKVT